MNDAAQYVIGYFSRPVLEDQYTEYAYNYYLIDPEWADKAEAIEATKKEALQENKAFEIVCLIQEKYKGAVLYANILIDGIITEKGEFLATDEFDKRRELEEATKKEAKNKRKMINHNIYYGLFVVLMIYIVFLLCF